MEEAFHLPEVLFMMCDNYVKFKSKSGRHLVFNGEQKKEEQNRNRRNKRHTAFLKNRIIPLTPKENASIISIVKTQSSEEGGKIKRQIAFRDKFKKYLDNKNKKKCSNQPKPFVSAVATGRFIDHANNGKNNGRNLWNQRDLGTIITSTALRPKKSALVAKLYDETISPVEIVSSLPIEQTTPRNGNENTSHYVSPFVTISREVKYSLDCRVEERQKKEAAAYFRLQIERERTRLDSLVSHWQHCADCESPADFRDMINVVIGQTKLLTTSKFKQFDNLIEQCERNECEEIVDLEVLILQKYYIQKIKLFSSFLGILVIGLPSS